MATRRRSTEKDVLTWRIRAELQRVDGAFVDLLAVRFQLVKILWTHKRMRRLSLEDARQEERVLARARGEAARRGLSPDFVGALFRRVIEEGKRCAAPAAPPPPGAYVAPERGRSDPALGRRRSTSRGTRGRGSRVGPHPLKVRSAYRSSTPRS